jgi:hypothetical protein
MAQMGLGSTRPNHAGGMAAARATAAAAAALEASPEAAARPKGSKRPFSSVGGRDRDGASRASRTSEAVVARPHGLKAAQPAGTAAAGIERAAETPDDPRGRQGGGAQKQRKQEHPKRGFGTQVDDELKSLQRAFVQVKATLAARTGRLALGP